MANNLKKFATSNSRSARISQSTQETESSLIQNPPALISHPGHGTPIKSSSHSEQPPTTVAAMRPSIAAELVGSVSSKKASAKNIYSSYNNFPIAKFLAECDLYDNRSKAWTQVKSEASMSTKESVLYEPLYNIIQAILLFFEDDNPSMRWTDQTHKKAMSHVEDGVRYYQTQADGNLTLVVVKTSPDLSIMGRGLNFCSTASMPTVSEYAHCLAPLEVKTEKTHKTEEVLNQVAVYARQCFIQQPHRRYVPTVVLTETHARLHVYDRSGVLRPNINVNYHTDPETFVRIILGISFITGELKSSAFDPRIKWEEDGGWPSIMVAKPVQADNDDQSRTLRSSSKPDRYQVTESPWTRRSIRGRGTVCWRALRVIPGKPMTDWVPVLVKDSWRSVGRQNEWELLKEVKGFAGVGQMIAYEDDTEYPISLFRNHVVNGLYENDKSPYNLDRIFCRIVLEAYGQSIKRFQTKLQLLHAFYDAVAGHKSIWMKGKILHRDISVENILLGKEKAVIGNRGILIDLDMAIKVDRTTNLSGGQFRTGTRAYQSVAVLSSAQWANFPSKAPPHDHLDDLESFFYVLAWICIKYDGPGKPIAVPMLEKWEKDDADDCAAIKDRYLSNPLIGVQPYFAKDKTMGTLLVSLADLCKEHLVRKDKLVKELEEEFPDLMTVYNSPNASSGKDHDRFMEIIKTAIDALESRPAEEPRPTHTDTAPVAGPSSEVADGPQEPKTPQRNRGAEKKRKTQESNEDEPAERKRTRGSREGSSSSRPQALSRTRSKSRAAPGAQKK